MSGIWERLVLELGAEAAGDRRPGNPSVDRRVLVQRRQRRRGLFILSFFGLDFSLRGSAVPSWLWLWLCPCKNDLAGRWY